MFIVPKFLNFFFFFFLDSVSFACLNVYCGLSLLVGFMYFVDDLHAQKWELGLRDKYKNGGKGCKAKHSIVFSPKEQENAVH